MFLKCWYSFVSIGHRHLHSPPLSFFPCHCRCPPPLIPLSPPPSSSSSSSSLFFFFFSFFLFFFSRGRRDSSEFIWSRTIGSLDVSTVPLAHRFACSLAPLTHLPAPQCPLGWYTLLLLFACSLAHSFTPSSWESDYMSQDDMVLSHSGTAHCGLEQTRTGT